MMTFSKIKWDGETVHLAYTDEHGDTFIYESVDVPRREFEMALADLAQDVLYICEIPDPDGLELSKLSIRGVTISHKSDIQGVVITALRRVTTCQSPMCLNTPHLAEAPYSEGSTAPLLPRRTAERVQELADEALKYLGGERAQGKLPVEGETPLLDEAGNG